MNKDNVMSIVKEVFPKIAKHYKSSAKVELYSDIYSRLNSIPAMDGYESYAEYHWDANKIYIYTNNISTEEDVIRSLIHECVHSKQSFELYEAFYECDLDYDTHPYEIEAEYEEENWIKYKI